MRPRICLPSSCFLPYDHFARMPFMMRFAFESPRTELLIHFRTAVSISGKPESQRLDPAWLPPASADYEFSAADGIQSNPSFSQ
jgi:hypothetical protein